MISLSKKLRAKTMTKFTTVHKHGPNQKYLRTVIPQCVLNDLKLDINDVLIWETLDNKTAIIRVFDFI